MQIEESLQRLFRSATKIVAWPDENRPNNFRQTDPYLTSKVFLTILTLDQLARVYVAQHLWDTNWTSSAYLAFDVVTMGS